MKNKLIILFWICIIFTRCGSESKKDALNLGDSAPSQVSNVIVENTPGGAILHYDTPNENQLLYVKAEYEIRSGEVKEIRSSYYNKSLTLEGFSEAKEYTVKLYSVSRGEKASEPLLVTIRPLTPPVVEIWKSLQVEETFGGIRINFENATAANVVISVLTTDSTGRMIERETYYTKREKGAFTARGFAPEKRKFGISIRDRWNNRSDTLYAEYTPWQEKQLIKSPNFKALNLANDTYSQHCCGTGITDLWDGSWNSANVFHTKPGTGLPQWFTIDLGVLAKLSRFKVHHRRSGGQGATDGAYTGGAPREIEIYGMSTPPPADGSWDSWTLLGTFSSTKPSGQPSGVVTTEDFTFAVVDGEDFDFDGDIPMIRYIRWKTNKVWGTLDHIYLSELTFWGDY